MELISAAIAGIFSVVILYFLSLILFLGPSLGISNREICALRSYLRKAINKKFYGHQLSLENIDSITALTRVGFLLGSLDIKRSIAFSEAVSGVSKDILEYKIRDLRKSGISHVQGKIDKIFDSEDSINIIYTKVRREILSYRIKMHVLGLLLFLREVLPRAVDRWGRYVTITAILAVIVGYSVWFLNGENGADGTGILIDKSIEYLSYGALISVIVAAFFEIAFGVRVLYLDKVLGVRGVVLFILLTTFMLVFMVLISMFLKINYISVAMLAVGSIRVTDDKGFWVIILIVLLGVSYSLRWCYRIWVKTLKSADIKLASVSVVAYLSFILFSLIIEPSKVSDRISSVILFLTIIFTIPFFISIFLKFLFMLKDSRQGCFRFGFSGKLLIASAILLFVSFGIFLFTIYKISILGDRIDGGHFASLAEYQDVLSEALITMSAAMMTSLIASIMLIASIVFAVRLLGKYGNYRELILRQNAIFSPRFYEKNNLRELMIEIKKDV